jgi:hypothetical protein
MIPFDSYDLEIADCEATHANWSNIWRLGVVVFTRPEDRICKDIIGPSLRYLHDLTGEKVHFYFVGFCDKNCWGYETSVSADFFGNNSKWYFSPKYFSEVQLRFERFTTRRWQYSGGTDILVVPYRIRNNIFYIDPIKALDIKLSKLAQQNKNYIPEEIIQIIVRQIHLGKDIDGISNSRIMDAVSDGFKKSLTSLMPSGLAGSFDVLEPFAVRDLLPPR